MRALSIKQPWAWAITHAGKRVENRTWSTGFRGELLIHTGKIDSPKKVEEFRAASKWMVQEGFADVLRDRGNPRAPMPDETMQGGIVAVAKMVDVLIPDDDRRVPWHMREQYGFVLEDVRPLRTLVSCSGRLGIFNVTPAVASAVLAELARR